jgi:plastocyanin
MRLLRGGLFRSVALGVLAVGAVVASPAVNAQWRATIGAQSADKGRQALAFLPNELWIHAGDTISWTFEADEPHTLTFLVPGTVRPAFPGCATVASGTSFDGSACVNTGALTKGQTFAVGFPAAGNFKFVCLLHNNMTGVVHVLEAGATLPHTQEFYDEQAANEGQELLDDIDRDAAVAALAAHNHGNGVPAGIGQIVATGGGSQTLSVVRFLVPTKVIHVGETVDWTNLDPVTPHTVTFGTPPANAFAPSANVTTDPDGALHATISSTTDNVSSGLIAAAPQDQTGLPQPPPGVTRFRVTFTQAGAFNYMCLLHGSLGMTGKVVVLP